MNKIVLAALLFLCALAASCGGGSGEVVVYVALDETFSKPVLDAFEAETGIKVRMLTDTEASKTVGLAMRIVEEKDNPRADVFWNNEIGWTEVLKSKGLLERYTPASASDIPAQYKDPDGFWTGFAARARVILYNTNLVDASAAPKSVAELALPIYRGRVAIARPVFGTTSTHVAALFSEWGDAKAKEYFLRLKANDCIVAAGNMMAAKMVAAGEAQICLTDTDDANEMLLDGKPVAFIYPDQAGMGALVLPNTACLIKNGPNPDNGRKFLEYLLSAEVEQRLAKMNSAQMPVRAGLSPYSSAFDLAKIKSMKTTYSAMAGKLDAAKEFMHAEFLK